MASSVSTEHLRSRLQCTLYDHDPGATTAVIVSPDGGTTKRTVDGRGVRKFMVGVMTTIGDMSKLEIIASAASDMSSPEVIKDSGAIVADAVGDQAWQECSAEEVAHIARTSGKALRYLAGRITMDTATDEAVACYVVQPDFERKDLTPATTIA